jgi:hypothetical protein
MFDKLKNLFKKPEPVVQKEKKPRKTKEKKVEAELTAKEKATQAGEPYVNVVRMELDPNDVNNGSFELDWNDKFILNLIKSGYKMKDDDTDQLIADRWFQTVCRNIALELYEQQQADPENRDIRVVRTKDLGNGRTEVS